MSGSGVFGRSSEPPRRAVRNGVKNLHLSEDRPDGDSEKFYFGYRLIQEIFGKIDGRSGIRSIPVRFDLVCIGLGHRSTPYDNLDLIA